MRSFWTAILSLVCLASLSGCGSIERSDLPRPPGDKGGPTITGNIAFQPRFLPITFTLSYQRNGNGDYTIAVGGSVVTSLGRVSVSAGVITRVSDGTTLPAAPADVTQLVICQQDGIGQWCGAYQIGTGRKIRIDMNGQFVQKIERNRTVINASPGSVIRVTDIGPPSKDLKAHGPARSAIERVTFEEFGPDTELDLERSRSGTMTDLAYDHVTGELRPINGAQVSKVTHPDGFLSSFDLDDLPSEYECQQATDWSDAFEPDELSELTVACIKTAEADLGYLVCRLSFEFALA